MIDLKSKISELRQKAESILKNRVNKTHSSLSEMDMLKLIHELEVHQIELEMQNDELNIANEKAKLAEDKYTELFDFAPIGYLSINRDGRITKLNFAAANNLGTDRYHLMNKSLLSFIADDSKNTFLKFLENVFLSTEKQTCEVVLKIPESPPIFAIIDGIQTLDNKECLIELIDITEKIKQYEELVIARDHAEESDRLKSSFLANMSHEIRTPMNGILGFAELLKDEELDTATRQDYVQIIEKSAERMLNTINEVIDISKIESGLMKLNITDVNINHCLDDYLKFFNPEATKKNIKLSLIKGLDDDEAIIKTDEDKLNGIFTNFIKNAIKFTHQGSIEFGYSLNNDSNELHFYVKDTGIGIPKHRQAAVFERFIQADIENKSAQQGSGLGLTISSAYIDMLLGKVWLESEESVGSTFHFTLPYKNEFVSKETRKVLVDRGAEELQKLKILIVEDDDVSSKFLKISINEYSKETLTAENGKDAVNMCITNPDIDLILMDIQLPNMNGYEVTKRIRDFNKDVIIIAQTAFALSGDIHKSISAGCNDYISKPIKKTELDNLIHKYFQQPVN